MKIVLRPNTEDDFNTLVRMLACGAGTCPEDFGFEYDCEEFGGECYNCWKKALQEGAEDE